MPEIEFDPVDTIRAGARGEPGSRVFFLHATRNDAWLTIKLEKEQVAVLAERMASLLSDAVEVSADEVAAEAALSQQPPDDFEPLFRALAIGLGYDTSRNRVVVELHENLVADETGTPIEDPGDEDTYVARLFLTPAQATAMAEQGAQAVAGGRPLCPLCSLPIDPDGHACPATNGHRTR